MHEVVRSVQDDEKHSQWEEESPIAEEKDEAEGVSEIGIRNSTHTARWRREINLDWGERRQLHDVTKFHDGDLIWGIVNLGVFANIRLWVNEYGYMCCSANGKITRVGSPEITYISLTDAFLLRKMLSLTSSQWAAVCESVMETRTVLSFDAFQAFEPRGKTSLEKMWFLICKRRHLLPKQCMLLKYCGAIKCMRRFDVIPKLVVQDIRSIEEGNEIRSVKPFVNSSELERTKDLAKRFCEDKNLGKKLQRLLEERAKSMDNWLADWWLRVAYLEYRDPVTIYSSPALVWPKREFASVEDQLAFAARVTKLALDFNRMIEKKKIPQDKLGGHSLCMSQYEKIFGTCRIPKVPRDELLFQDSQNPSTNIIVMYNNHLFSIPAFLNDEREPLGARHFYSMLLDVVAEGSNDSGVPVGVLTTGQRDNWAKSYEELKKDAKNRRILQEHVERALFVVCLDKPAPSGSDRFGYGTGCSKLLLHGHGSRGNAGNRWYDKTIQFVVGAGADGVGVVYEHSPAEGGPIGVLTDFVNSAMNEDDGLQALPSYPKPEKLEFVFSDALKEDISAAGEALDRLSDDLEVHGWHFADFGKNDLKRLNVSPDSFVQIAIQLAFYKLHGRAAAQYESGSLRKFVYGRTDTIRSCSEEVVGFCETISDPAATPSEASAALRRAVDSHKAYAREVMEGRGVDRHLLGLKILAEQNDLELPKIFSDAAFERSTHFQLSTSNVPTACDAFMVYGPLVHDGYGCCYNPRGDSINFGISAWVSCETTSVDAFRGKLEEALASMRLCLVGSKL